MVSLWWLPVSPIVRCSYTGVIYQLGNCSTVLPSSILTSMVSYTSIPLTPFSLRVFHCLRYLSPLRVQAPVFPIGIFLWCLLETNMCNWVLFVGLSSLVSPHLSSLYVTSTHSIHVFGLAGTHIYVHHFCAFAIHQCNRCFVYR